MAGSTEGRHRSRHAIQHHRKSAENSLAPPPPRLPIMKGSPTRPACDLRRLINLHRRERRTWTSTFGAARRYTARGLRQRRAGIHMSPHGDDFGDRWQAARGAAVRAWWRGMRMTSVPIGRWVRGAVVSARRVPARWSARRQTYAREDALGARRQVGHAGPLRGAFVTRHEDDLGAHRQVRTRGRCVSHAGVCLDVITRCGGSTAGRPRGPMDASTT